MHYSLSTTIVHPGLFYTGIIPAIGKGELLLAQLYSCIFNRAAMFQFGRIPMAVWCSTITINVRVQFNPVYTLWNRAFTISTPPHPPPPNPPFFPSSLFYFIYIPLENPSATGRSLSV